MISKKAQGGPGLGTIIAVGVMLVAAILIILYLLDVFNTVGDFTEISPSALSAKAELCKGLVSSQVAYCEFTEVEKDKYINCEYDNADFRATVGDATFDCAADGARDKCQDLNTQEGSKVSINGELCTKILNSNLGSP